MIVKEEILKEYRTRLCLRLRGIKQILGFYNSQYELNLTSGDALVILLHSVNWDLDNSEKPLNAWYSF